MNNVQERDCCCCRLPVSADSGAEFFRTAGEVPRFVGEAMAMILSALLDVLPGL